jgi:cell division protein FtsW
MILFFLLFIKKLSYHYLVLLSSFVFLFLLLNILQHPYQLNRILFFLFSSTLTDTFTGNIPVPSQLTQSLETILRGGIWGVGLGCSDTNANTFPIYYADFIFSVFFENFGLFGSIFFFLFLNFFSSFYIFNCLKLKKSLDITICLGCFLFLSFQTCIHLAVTCNLLPITGIPLPFISYGGNAQFACLSLLSLSIRLFYENIRPIQRQNNFTFNTKKHLLIDTK